MNLVLKKNKYTIMAVVDKKLAMICIDTEREKIEVFF